MEKHLTRNELFSTLLKKAKNPFTTIEQKNDIRRILMESTTMRGMNHIYLLKCHFDENPIFNISKKEAIHQANLAMKENNTDVFYYLYLLCKEDFPSRARNYLRLACTYGKPEAYLEIGRLKKEGILFEKNTEEAFESYRIAADCNLKEGYFGMLLIASEKQDYELEQQIYKEAIEKGIELPGIIK